MIQVNYNSVETSTEVKFINEYSKHKCHAWISYSFNSLMQKLTISVQYKTY
jgi:hypothetical protein